MNAKSYDVPKLAIDATLERLGVKIDARGRLERRIVAALCAHLKTFGFEPRSVYDGDEDVTARTPKDVMEIVFNLDDARVCFGKDIMEHGVLLVLGNGEDIVSDWSFAEDDADGFNAAMEAFDAAAIVAAL